MKDEMTMNIIVSVVTFILAFVIFFLIGVGSTMSKKKKGKKNQILAVRYLVLRNNIKEADLVNKKFFALSAFINAFIISIVFFLIELLNWHIVLRLMLGFILLFGLIYSIYGILGNILEKRYKK